MSLSQMDGCAALVQDCLNSSDPAEPLLTLCADPKPLAGLAEGDKPHPLVGIVTAMMAGALIDSGGPGDVEVVIERVAELSSRHATGPMFAAAFRRSRRRLPLSASRGHSYPPRFCRLPDGILGRAACRRWLRHQQRWTLPDDPILAPILAHPGIAAYGPFSIERGWLLDRRDATLASFKPDRNLERTSLFDELFILNALLSEQPERALAVIEKRGLLSAPEIVAVGDTSRGHLEFNAACVLAVLGRFEEALSLARTMVRRGTTRFGASISSAPAKWPGRRICARMNGSPFWRRRRPIGSFSTTTSAAGPSESTTQRAICYARCAKTSGTPRRRSGPGCPTGWSRPVSRCAHAAAVRPCDGWGFRHRGEGRLRSIGLVRCPHAIPDRHCSLHPSFPGSGRRSSRQMAQSGRLRNIAGMSAATLPRSISTAP